jgi:hypothetical protein
MASMPLISALIVGNMRRRSLSEVMVTVVSWKECATSSHQATYGVFVIIANEKSVSKEARVGISLLYWYIRQYHFVRHSYYLKFL